MSSSSPAAAAFSRVAGLKPGDVAEGALMAATMENGGRLCVGRFQGALFAVKDSCPHREYPLSEGTLYPDGTLECCWHGAAFDCRTGAVLRGPTDQAAVVYEIEERDGAVFARRVTER